MKYFNQIIISVLILFVFTFSLIVSPLKSFWLDEVFSVNFSRDWTALWHGVRYTELNMSLYHIILHFWMRFGASELSIRMLSTIFACATIPLIYLVGKRLFNKLTGIVAATLISFNMFFIAYSQEARSYSMFLFFSTVSIYFLTRILEKPKRFINYFCFALATTLSIYAHLFTVFLVFAELTSIVFLFRKAINWKYLSISGGMLFLLCLPLLLSPSLENSQIGWIPRPGILNLIGFPFVLGGDFPLTFLVTGGLFLYLAIYVAKYLKKPKINRETFNKYIFLIILLTLPPAVAFSFSYFIKPIVTSKYLIYCLVPFLILTANALSLIKNNKITIAVLGLLILFSSFRLYAWYAGNEAIHWAISNQKDDWKGIEEYIDDNAQPNDAVTFYSYFIEQPFVYYDTPESSNPKFVDISSNPNSQDPSSNLPQPNISMISSFNSKYSRVWLILSGSDFGVSNRLEQKDLIQKTLSKHYRLIKTVPFGRLQVLLYSI